MLNKIYLFNQPREIEHNSIYEQQWIFINHKQIRTTLLSKNTHIICSNTCPFWLHVATKLKVPKGKYFIFTETSAPIQIGEYIQIINDSINPTMLTSLASGLTDVIAIRDNFP